MGACLKTVSAGGILRPGRRVPSNPSLAIISQMRPELMQPVGALGEPPNVKAFIGLATVMCAKPAP